MDFWIYSQPERFLQLKELQHLNWHSSFPPWMRRNNEHMTWNMKANNLNHGPQRVHSSLSRCTPILKRLPFHYHCQTPFLWTWKSEHNDDNSQNAFIFLRFEYIYSPWFLSESFIYLRVCSSEWFRLEITWNFNFHLP